MTRIAALVVAALLAAACSSTPPPELEATGAEEAHAGPAPEPADPWTVSVSATGRDLGPLAVSVGAVEPAPRNDATPWLRHELVLTNTGDEPLRLADTRSSRFAGEGGRRTLLVADEGCGYATGVGGRIEAGVCRLVLDAPVLEPGESVTRTVTLFEGLPGMAPLAAGEYAVSWRIRFRPGRELPTERAGRSATVRLHYSVERAAE